MHRTATLVRFFVVVVCISAMLYMGIGMYTTSVREERKMRLEALRREAYLQPIEDLQTTKIEASSYILEEKNTLANDLRQVNSTRTFPNRAGVSKRNMGNIILIFPFRNREVHYEKMMKHLKSIRRPNWEIHKILVEQANDEPFQRAWLLNVGIAEAKKRFNNSSACVVTHDIDMLADENVDYSWCDRPTQICSELSCFNRGVPYRTYAGGVVQATMAHWYQINGFTNNAKGWGGEDDDLYHRFRINGLLDPTTKALRRPVKGYGQCNCMHDGDHTKRLRDEKGYRDILEKLKRMSKGSDEWKLDGLNSLKYYIISEHKDEFDTLHLKVHHSLKDFQKLPNQTPYHKLSSNIIDRNPRVYGTLIGRLGNQLFQWASLQGIASKNSMSTCVRVGDTFQSSSIFSVFTAIPNTCSVKQSNIPHVGEAGKYATYRDLHFENSVVVDGYLQSYKYFPPDLYNRLKFKEAIVTKAKAQITDEKTNIGIHVRHRHQLEVDYLRFPPNDYFENVMSQFRRDYPNAFFYVASDDVAWCRQQTFFQRSDVKIIENNPGLDMAVLASCDHVVLTVGTFGWWAAFLGAHRNGGKVVYYKDEFVMEHKVNKGNVVKEDYYPKEWKEFQLNLMHMPTIQLGSGDKIMTKGLWDGSPIVIEKFKLLFWTIPKNSCEEFKLLFRRMEGFTDWKTRYNFPKGYAYNGAESTLPHNPAKNGLKYLYNYSVDDANSILNDKTWTKAIFLRHPLERFVSAYLDKIVNHKYFNKKMEWDFPTFVSKVENGLHDKHWDPQCKLINCEKWLPTMTFIGNIETVAEDAEKLLRKIGAWEQFGLSGWGQDGKSAIFKGSKNKQHTTDAKNKQLKYYNNPTLKRRVENLMSIDFKFIHFLRKIPTPGFKIIESNPYIDKDTTGILGVLSHTQNRDLRDAIRKTWASISPFKVNFLLDMETPQLIEENVINNDIIFINSSFSGRAVKFGDKLIRWYQYVFRTYPNIKWVGKCDDDVVVNTEKMNDITIRNYSPLLYMGWKHGTCDKPSQTCRIDEMIVIIGSELLNRLVKRKYCNTEQCDKTTNLYDTNYGGTSLGLWLSIYDDIKMVSLNNQMISRFTKTTTDLQNILSVNGLKSPDLITKVYNSMIVHGSSATGSVFTGDRVRRFSVSKNKTSTFKNLPTLNISSATGTLFNGEKTRQIDMSFVKGRKLLTTSLNGPTFKTSKCMSENWAVVTTINSLTEAVRKIVVLKKWCIVIVGDLNRPKHYEKFKNLDFLGESQQRDLSKTMKMISFLKWNHFGRKNIGYLYAIANGARYIFDFDDDNIITQDPLNALLYKHKCSPDDSFYAYNPYPALNSSENLPWPRGIPLEHYNTIALHRDCSTAYDKKLNIVVYQSAANNDPDVDAIYRLTRKPQFFFNSESSRIDIPENVFVPYNAQATIHLHDGMWALLLPISVEGRVSDIWRSYFAQKIMWLTCSGVSYTSPFVKQIRNGHNYLADLQAEEHLYTRTGALLRFLQKWTCQGNVPDCMKSMWIDLYERNYIEIEDINLLHVWISELDAINYKWPSICNAEAR